MNTKSEQIYAITVARFMKKDKVRYRVDGKRKVVKTDPYIELDDRTWGFFHSFEKAEKDLEINGDTLYESDNKYACITALREGTLNFYDDSDKVYYVWEGSWEEGGYVRQDKMPKELEEYFGKNVCNYMQPF
ncbi:hypothetical protein DRO61_09955 [Candidatus Bathyarchaeota archaeon]|nr:MAG: hypothetical protein DRO61_09955 [Candidatus Bathyarchaeota archaeon]